MFYAMVKSPCLNQRYKNGGTRPTFHTLRTQRARSVHAGGGKEREEKEVRCSRGLREEEGEGRKGGGKVLCRVFFF